MKASYVNEVIVGSIPIDKNLKRWLVSRYRKLCGCNGRAYASDVFKTAKEVCMAYRADPRRLEKVSEFERKLPFRCSGWTRRILMYMDTCPHFMIDLLKLYVSEASPVVTVEESADRQHSYLRDTGHRVDPTTPVFLKEWLHHFVHRKISSKEWLLWDYYGWPRWISGFARNHSYLEYSRYYNKWHSILTHVKRVGEVRARRDIESKMPVPEVYKDFNPSDVRSHTLEDDYWVICSLLDTSGLVPMTGWFQSPVLSEESVAYVRSYLSQNPLAHGLVSDDTQSIWIPGGGLSFLSGETVGEIQHIPKKGTVKRRPIAVPNRFLQMGLAPIYDQLGEVLRNLPCDCTFDQDKFDVKIANRVTNPNLYVGSVDLSQATDNLPRAWGIECVEQILLWRMSPTVKSSWNLFLEMASGRWDNDGHVSSWPIGQPLGTLPSFNLLALTHNLLLEALSFTMGYGHSPYCILGDDLLVFNKKLRKAYIRLMLNAGVPLSLHKSYEGNLVEFAGKVFIRNQVPAYTSDHASITWNSLFDYQRATGVRIPWYQLPSKLRKKFERTVSRFLTKCDARRVYEFCQLAMLDTRGSLRQPLSQRLMDQLAAFYLNLDEEEKDLPDPNLGSGIVNISGHPVTYGDYGYADKGGHLVRFQEVQLPRWYKDKFRPCATDKIAIAAAQALRGA
jgi:hypothetical protein